MEDNELTDREKGIILLKNLYKEIPVNIEEAVEKGIRFLDRGKSPQGSESQKLQDRRYSFKKDDNYIYSAVDRVLSGRLSKGELVHWWEFVMAFMEMPEDCMISKIIYYRTQYAKGKLTPEERRAYNESIELFELPMEMDAEEEEKHNEFMGKLGINSVI